MLFAWLASSAVVENAYFGVYVLDRRLTLYASAAPAVLLVVKEKHECIQMQIAAQMYKI